MASNLLDPLVSGCTVTQSATHSFFSDSSSDQHDLCRVLVLLPGVMQCRVQVSSVTAPHLALIGMCSLRRRLLWYFAPAGTCN